MQEIFRFDHQGVNTDATIRGRFLAAGIRSMFADRKVWGCELPVSLFRPDH